jgi:septal ring factor EnvC (AmiA/AmiB activator)
MFDLSDVANIKANSIADEKIAKYRAERAVVEQKTADLEKQIEQDENKIKRLTQSVSQKARNARTKRLIERGAIAESYVMNAETLTNDEFKDLLSRAFQVAN